MRLALADLRELWRTRRSSGFPWPGYRDMGGRVSWRRVVLGYGPWTAVPVWRQALTIPLRPWRYARMVRGVARTRNFDYAPSLYDDVP